MDALQSTSPNSLTARRLRFPPPLHFGPFAERILPPALQLQPQILPGRRPDFLDLTSQGLSSQAQPVVFCRSK